MRKKELLTFLNSKANDLFGLSFAIIPNKNKAQDIILNSLKEFLKNESDIVECMKTVKEDEEGREHLEEFIFNKMIFYILKSGYKIQDEITPEEKIKYGEFYNFDYISRMALYIITHLNSNSKEYLHILKNTSAIHPHDILAKLNVARDKLISSLDSLDSNVERQLC